MNANQQKKMLATDEHGKTQIGERAKKIIKDESSRKGAKTPRRFTSRFSPRRHRDTEKIYLTENRGESEKADWPQKLGHYFATMRGMKPILSAARFEMPTLFVVLFAIGFVMVIVWFCIIVWLFNRLRTQHPSKYQELGSPNLFSPKSDNAWRLLRFLWSSQPRELGDQALVNVVVLMRVWFVCYLALFVTLMVWFLMAWKQHG